MSSLYNAILRDKAFSLKYLLGLLNSRLFQFLMYKLTFEKTRGAFTKAKIFHYYELPVKDCSPVSQQEIIGTVDEILAEKKKNPMVNVGNLEFRLNKLVYDLYGLTDDEIRIVEECVP